MTEIFKVNNEPEPAQILATYILENINTEMQRRVIQHRDTFYAFWYSKEATPQQICDKMGRNAGLFISVSAANISHLAEIALRTGKTLHDFLTEDQYMPPKTMTVNPDGTVTIGEEIVNTNSRI